MEFEAYFDSLKGKRAAVLGFGVSNRPLARLLCARGIETEIRDRQARDAFGGLVEEYEALGARFHLGESYLDDIEADVIFRSPGIMPSLGGIPAAVAGGACLTSEMEAFFAVCPCPVIGITGSDGKTTTSTLIAEMLKAAGETVHLGGNIGTPLLDRVPGMTPGHWVVVELSSFQLMTMKSAPQIAVVTNVEPNHLDIHSSMEEYVAAKKAIFLGQRASDRLVLNMDNAETAKFAGEAPGKTVFFSRRRAVFDGAFLEDDVLCAAGPGGVRRLFERARIAIPGMHNVENYLAAIAALDGIVPDRVFGEVAERFQGVAHRIEFVREIDGVRYYNDSIASSPTRTLAGLRAFDKKVILIAGGYDKNLPYAPLAEALLDHVRLLILSGDNSAKIREAALAAGYPEALIREEATYESALAFLRGAAEAGDTVLLSPAAASFDRYKNFAERGEAFKTLIYKL
ncbi:UDP-N-acetylmuramoyl-L-alanine--D-glutamate ligase [Oscillospiraceae bacterium OttesenSCG-928-F05]|nr:UDP-N-acetylmuramoyl-L-alanine--D-glutamate ligase [Oscillospiraceae bacterium OttesenSCG-928-F05]